VGTVRISFADEADLGEYVALYRMRRFGEFYPGGICMTTRLVILPEYRNSTLPMRLMKGCYCDEEVIRRGVCFDLIDCKPHHVPLFRRFGYRQVMPNITNPFAGESQPMVLAVFDRPCLRRIGSPFARCRGDIHEGHPSVRFFYDHLLPAGGAAVGIPPVAVA
jgi:hypothetical protein